MHSISVKIKTDIDRESKKNAEEIIDAPRVTPSAAIEAFCRAVISQKGLSFLLEIPKEETEKALKLNKFRRNNNE